MYTIHYCVNANRGAEAVTPVEVLEIDVSITLSYESS